MTKDESLKVIEAVRAPMTRDEYFAESEERKVVTPENLGDLLEYPALFRAMQDDRELRPALSESLTTGRALADFLSLPPEKFLETYVVVDGPVNPKTGKPYGTDTKAYAEWRATQEKTPVSPEQFNMFGKMAIAYSSHEAIKTLDNHECVRNVVLKAEIGGVPCMCLVDKMYVADSSIIAVDVKTTSDLVSFPRSVDSLHYRAQQALILLVAEAVGLKDVYARIAAIEKGPLPRCGVFRLSNLRGPDEGMQELAEFLGKYGESLKTGKYRTLFEAERTI
jgi:hypothetical protein